MKWSWRIGRLAGIDVFMHMTFPLLLAWAGLQYYQVRADPADVIVGLAFVGMLFAIVVLHELGHALMARRFGIGTSDITLLPIGGVARLMRMPADPKQELFVALAGPAVNVALAALLAVVLIAFTEGGVSGGIDILFGNPLVNLFWVNVGLAIFNMVPAFPMDGGRVLRALLAMRLDFARATRIAAVVGQLLAVSFGILGLMGNPILVLIAVFVWMGAQAEVRASRGNRQVPDIPVRMAMIAEFRRLTPGDSLATAAHYALSGVQGDFPVSDHGRLLGLLSAQGLAQGIRRLGPGGFVDQAMERDVVTADSDEPIETAWARLQASGQSCLPVLTAGVLVGLITRAQLQRVFQLQGAIGEHARTTDARRA